MRSCEPPVQWADGLSRALGRRHRECRSDSLAVLRRARPNVAQPILCALLSARCHRLILMLRDLSQVVIYFATGLPLAINATYDRPKRDNCHAALGPTTIRQNLDTPCEENCERK